jgi:L-threonine kinase
VTTAHSKVSVEVVGIGQCPLVLGECVQGQVDNGRHFLITSPIGLFSWAEYYRTEHALRVQPTECWKALTAVRTYLQQAGLAQQGLLRIRHPLDPGQGFGTSTADVTAALRAVSAAYGVSILPQAIARIAIEIEPTDGSMFTDCVAFAHREGVLLEHLGVLPRFNALVICTGGVVDTVEFDQRRKDFRYSTQDQEGLKRAWDMVREAIRTSDATLLARAATISSVMNQRFLPKPGFTDVKRLVESGAAEGIMVAHSGTALALIFNPKHPGYESRIAAAREYVEDIGVPQWFETSNRAIVQKVVFRNSAASPSGHANRARLAAAHESG